MELYLRLSYIYLGKVKKFRPNQKWFRGSTKALKNVRATMAPPAANRVKKLDDNYEKCYSRPHDFSRHWARYNLLLKGRITIVKTFLYPQFICAFSVLDPSETTYKKIN